MERIYDEQYNVVGYVEETLKSYFNPDAKICGLCMYPYELVRIRRVRGVATPSKYAIIHVKHTHTPATKPTLVLKRWIRKDEFRKFMEMNYSELLEELGGDC
jgi:hypothetical protein